MGTLVAATEFFLEVLQELPIAIAVARRTVIQVRIINQVFRAMSIVRIVLVRHPVRVAFGEPARMAVVAHPARNALQAVREFMRSAPVILEGAHANPHTGAEFIVQALHVVLPAVERRHDGIVEHINVALEFFIGATRERQHPAERIDVEGINLLKRCEHALRIRIRNGHVVRLAVVRRRLLADLKMIRFGDQRKAVTGALVYPFNGGVRAYGTCAKYRHGKIYTMIDFHTFFPNNTPTRAI